MELCRWAGASCEIKRIKINIVKILVFEDFPTPGTRLLLLFQIEPWCVIQIVANNRVAFVEILGYIWKYLEYAGARTHPRHHLVTRAPPSDPNGPTRTRTAYHRFPLCPPTPDSSPSPLRFS